jgi:hypothetical protein
LSADLVAGNRHGIGERQGRTEEFRVAHREGVLKTIFQRVPPDEEKTENQHDYQEAKGEADLLGEGKLPPALMQPM